MDINITYELDDGAFPPVKAHTDDAGYDIKIPIGGLPEGKQTYYLRWGCSCVIDTGVHVNIPSGYVGVIKSKSGLNVNHELVTEGVIDAGYSGSIKVKVYNHGFDDYKLGEGDRITQLVILPIPKVTMVEGKMPTDTERGANGFGSTGR